MYDIVIIGGGVVGGMIARELSRYELSICILEAENDVAMGATKANSAIVHAGFDAKEGSLKAKLNVLGSEMMKQVCEELGVKYKNNGSMVIGFNDEDKKMLEELYRRGAKNGVKGLELISGDEARRLEPQLSDNITCALRANTGAIVCPYELTVAAIGNAMDNGTELKTEFKVDKIEKTDSVYKIYSSDRFVESKYVINAAGLYSDEIAALIGDNSFCVHPRRGEYILLDKECGGLLGHTVFRTPSKMGKGILITPTVDGNLLLGPTSVDMTDKSDKSTSDEGFEKIISQARENIKTLPMGKVITSFTGLRAVGDRGDFIINSPKKGFINLGGIESPGLTSAPAIAVTVCEMLEKSGLEMRQKPDFSPCREPMHKFRESSIEEKNAIILNDRSYGKIVCRCEGITEGEILRSIRTNPKPSDLDGVKRRTRAQMGRCQGGFCSPYIIELLAEEMGISEDSVTKCGGASKVILGRTKG